ncbi:MAG: hypothetical protein CMH55_06555 [Myxococcales bacterium]|nr:hypothetical protein [Myxococcales bacterium]
MKSLPFALVGALLLAGCAAPQKPPPRREAPSFPPLPSALPAPPEASELPKIVDSSLQFFFSPPRQNGKVRVRVEFKVNGYLEADDLVALELTKRRRPVGRRLECPQRRSARSGVTVECTAKSDSTAGEIPVSAGTYDFLISLKREGRYKPLRRGRFQVFKCSAGVCLNRDGILGEHWAHFENRKDPRLVFRLAFKSRSAMPAMHPDPKRQAKAKAGTAVETLTTTCYAGKKKLGRSSESFMVLEDDGVWVELLARSDLFLQDLQDLGKGPLRCKVNLNAKPFADLRLILDEDGGLVPHPAQTGEKGLQSPWWWVKAYRPGRQDSRAKAGARSIKRLRLNGRF